MIELADIVGDFAASMERVDARRPIAVNVRTKQPYQPGVGPHTEAQTVRLVATDMLATSPERYAQGIALEVSYPAYRRKKCDLCIGEEPIWQWAIEVKMFRLMGDNGKLNDNLMSHILSPYPGQRSAVTDTTKLLASGLRARKAILIYGYDYPDWPMDPGIDAFELIAQSLAELGERYEASVTGLVHPVHQRGRVFAWEIA